uniref:Homologous-pairing protein 2 winged helix domain-containing protein n=1 Tax=Trypanosoma congolense (strain IL3000) TaxID=1068625 RepID=G0UJJ8_TRYCI|nr:conserved hypothetical protein [Trypanosoma congolense IL3000]
MSYDESMKSPSSLYSPSKTPTPARKKTPVVDTRMVTKNAKKPGEEDVEAAIINWFECEGEPATAQSLTDALGSRFGKQIVQNTLERCLEHKKLQAKDIKKARFYFLVSPTCGSGEEDSAKAALVQQLQRQRREVSELASELDALQQLPAATARATTITSLMAECKMLIARQESLRQAASNKRERDCESVSLLIHRYHRARELWKDRKHMAVRIIDAVLGDNCGTKDLTDVFGLSTDEQMNVSLAGTALRLPEVERT